MEIVKSENTKILKYILIIFLGSILLTVSSKIKIPFYPVPMTMQTFVVLFLGMSFGYKIGLASVGLYLIEGIIGLPVFSNSPEKGIGLAYFTGPTMGYLIGFLFATFLAGYFNYKVNIFFTLLRCLPPLKFVLINVLTHFNAMFFLVNLAPIAITFALLCSLLNFVDFKL